MQLIETGLYLFKKYGAANRQPGSVSDRIKELTNRNGRYSLSMTQSQEIMFMKLPTTQAQKDLCSPEEALIEMEQLISLTFDKLFFIQDQEGAQLEKGFAKVVKENGQPDIPTQVALIKGLMSHRYSKLNLPYATALTSADLKELIKKSGDHHSSRSSTL